MRFKRSILSLALAASVAMPISGAIITEAGAATPPNMLVVAGRIDDLISLDPQEMFEFSGTDIANNIYDKLVVLDPSDLSKGYGPGLAESWEISEDGKTFTFKMREGIKFHSGNPVTAKDAEFSLRRAVALKKTPSFIVTQFGFTAENMNDTIKAVDENTFQITTDKKYAPSFVLNCFTAVIASIVDSELVKANEVDGDWGNGWLRTNSAGSGAFKLQNWKPNESYSLTAVPGYWRGDVAMKRVIVRHVMESASQRLMLEKGDVDVARHLSPEDVAAISTNEDLKVEDTLRGRLMYISFNQKDQALAHPKVAEALKYLVDYKGMTGSFLKGQYTIQQAFLPQTYMGELKDTPYSLNVEKAKELLAEAGYADGFDVEFIVRNATERLEIAQSLQNTFAQAGINASITTGTGKQILGRYRARDFQIYVGAWGPDYPDPHTNADTFANNPDNRDEAKLTGKLAWRVGYPATDLTVLTDLAVQESDREKRARMYVEAQKVFQKEAPFAVMFQQIEQNSMRENVSGFNPGGAVTGVFYWPVKK
ncbi:ABC transporter substrate-binding protein [Pseudovibrio japonicus]|uniref:ABC transporter substrate-binding protein n=1 Tax=Pseudovibrio japonicus TaxID=366534 RepID=A0ABQ3E8H9_9HYPH|nr:ABC transporter substrate-binding protein [Pseudovibrio japonicus]GHB29690.1 ABC transporter substrate-binding protein [Pseudovibrio japonicus]